MPSDERTAPAPASPEVGSEQDHADYLEALVAAFGEDMGDGAEITLACEIDRLKRLAKQAVAMRQVLGPDSWHVDGEGIAKLLETRLAKPEQPPVTAQELPACAAILTTRNVIIAGKRHHDCLASAHDLFVAKQDIAEQGFMTTLGRFVDRREAMVLMKAAGRQSADSDGYRGDELYSEDLYCWSADNEPA